MKELLNKAIKAMDESKVETSMVEGKIDKIASLLTIVRNQIITIDEDYTDDLGSCLDMAIYALVEQQENLDSIEFTLKRNIRELSEKIVELEINENTKAKAKK